MDTRVTSYKILLDHSEDGLDKECEIDKTMLHQDPILVKVEHKTPLIALRKTLFHAGELVTDVIQLFHCMVFLIGADVISIKLFNFVSTD